MRQLAMLDLSLAICLLLRLQIRAPLKARNQTFDPSPAKTTRNHRITGYYRSHPANTTDIFQQNQSNR